jgi:hypothetical protein
MKEKRRLTKNKQEWKKGRENKQTKGSEGKKDICKKGIKTK